MPRKYAIPKLKPCPFCGSESLYVERMELNTFQMVCNDCFAHGPSHDDPDSYGDTQPGTKEFRDVARLWNRRRPRKPEPVSHDGPNR